MIEMREFVQTIEGALDLVATLDKRQVAAVRSALDAWCPETGKPYLCAGLTKQEEQKAAVAEFSIGIDPELAVAMVAGARK